AFLHHPHVAPTERRAPALLERFLRRQTGRPAGHHVAAPGPVRQFFGMEAPLEAALPVPGPHPPPSVEPQDVDADGADHGAAPATVRGAAVRVITPSSPATKARSTMPRNRPCSMTPGTASRALANARASKAAEK